jgi:hypothetical protein
MGYEQQGSGHDSGARGHELQGREQQPVDEKRQRMLASLAKARETRAANIKARAELGPELGRAHAPARRIAKRQKTVKTRLNEAIVQHKAAKKELADDWLDGIHHAPNGCPRACRPDRCVITHENVCAHPDTNLQAKYMSGGFPEVNDRFQAAKHELRRLDAEKSLKK